MAISAMLRSLAQHPRTCDRLAFTGDDDLTFAQVQGQANTAQQLMRELGVKRGDVVGAVLYNESSMYAIMLACCMIGAAILPLNPRLHPSERNALLHRTKARVCWASSQLPGPPQVQIVDTAQLLVPSREHPASDEGTTEDLCWIAATGGTTGVPKLYAVTQGNLLDNLLINTADWELDRHGVHVSAAPLAHGIGFCNALAQLLHGGTVHLDARLSADAALAAMARYRACWTALVPTILFDLTSAAQQSLPCLELVVCAGSTLPAKVRRAVADRFPRADIREYYGSTEMGWVTSHNSEQWQHAPGSVGLPTRGTELRILTESGMVAAPGEIGVIHKRGRPYAVGRFEELEHHRIGWSDWVSSGDRGHIDDQGRLHLAGRVDDLIIVGGLNVDPTEVIQVLVEHPDVSAVLIEGRPDERLGQQLHAYVETSRTDEAMAAELVNFARGRMSTYKMPSSFEFRTQLPRTAAGKISLAAIGQEGSR
ncbi:MAG: class I adenylate-forming enzyme family protein [Beutenbergiaceae bacterium]